MFQRVGENVNSESELSRPKDPRGRINVRSGVIGLPELSDNPCATLFRTSPLI
jgi:hypothetical protein